MYDVHSLCPTSGGAMVAIEKTPTHYRVCILLKFIGCSLIIGNTVALGWPWFDYTWPTQPSRDCVWDKIARNYFFFESSLSDRLECQYLPSNHFHSFVFFSWAYYDWFGLLQTSFPPSRWTNWRDEFSTLCLLRSDVRCSIGIQFLRGFPSINFSVIIVGLSSTFNQRGLFFILFSIVLLFTIEFIGSWWNCSKLVGRQRRSPRWFY